MAPMFGEFDSKQVTRDELLKVVEHEEHISCLLENVAGNALKFFDVGKHFHILEDGADSIKTEAIKVVADSLDSYAGLVLAENALPPLARDEWEDPSEGEDD